MKLTLESPELTALVLGELTDDRRQEVEAIVSTRPDLQAEVEQLRQLTKLVGTALQGEPAWQLSAERRQLILKKGMPDRTSRPRKTRYPAPTDLLGWYPWTGWAIGLSMSAALCLFCLFYFNRPTRPVGNLALLTTNAKPQIENEVLGRNLLMRVDRGIQTPAAPGILESSARLKSTSASASQAEAPAVTETVLALSTASKAEVAFRPSALSTKTSSPSIATRFAYLPPELLSPPLNYIDSGLPQPTQLEGFDDSGFLLVRTRILEGVRPLPEFVRLEELINYFRYDDLVSGPPDETNAYRAQLELVTCPWNAQHSLLRVAIQVWGQPGKSPMGRRLILANDGTTQGSNTFETGQFGKTSSTWYAAVPSPGIVEETRILAKTRAVKMLSAAPANKQLSESLDGARKDTAMPTKIDEVQSMATNGVGFETNNTPVLKRFAEVQREPSAARVTAGLSWNTNQFGRWRMLGHGRPTTSTNEPLMSLNAAVELTPIEPEEINPIRPGSQFVAMYELAPQPFAIGDWVGLGRDAKDVVKLRVSTLSSGVGAATLAKEVEVSSKPKLFSEASVDFRFSTAVVGFGLLLRDVEDHLGLTWDMVLDMARSGMGADVDGSRAEFVDLVSRAKLIAAKTAAKKGE